MADVETNTGFAALDAIAPRRGAAVMLEVLRSEGVRYIFGNPGTTEIPLIDALHGVPELSYILGLQEASVVSMAHGYAQASGQPGFVNLHAAGGLGHAMGALLNAQVSRTPLVVTAGQQDTRHGYTEPLLYGDLVAIAGPVAKSAHEIIHPEQIPVMVRRAFHDSIAAPAGPVFLALPIDVMERETTVAAGARSQIERRSVAGGLDELGAALAAVRPGRLAILVGDEVFVSDASAEVVALAEGLGAPVFGSSWPSYLPFPTSHPLWAGSLPTQASEIRAQLEPFDAVFALGGNSTITYLYSEGPAVPPSCRLFQLSADIGELGHTYATARACVGDLRASLRALLPMLADKLVPQRDAILARREHAARVRAAQRVTRARDACAELDAPVATPRAAAAEIIRAIGPRVAIVDEAPVTMRAVREFLDSPSARQYFWMRSAILGWGMPAAVGVSLGLGREPVVSLVGDGSSLYSPQALWTAARERLPVTFIVINNREYNILKNYMRGRADSPSARTNRFIAMDLVDPAIDFLALAAAMGVPARRIERAAEIAGAVEAGIASGLPNLIEVRVSAEAR